MKIGLASVFIISNWGLPTGSQLWPPHGYRRWENCRFRPAINSGSDHSPWGRLGLGIEAFSTNGTKTGIITLQIQVMMPCRATGRQRWDATGYL